jgi:DNA-binding transcriptional LysR family regulator
MDLEELHNFVRVVEAGSFLAAADQLGVSRTTLRRRVGSLEARVGVPLLQSTQNGVALTEAGRRLAARARHLLEEASTLLSSVREAGEQPSGILRISVPVGLPPSVLVALFGAMRLTFPDVRVESRFSEDPLAESMVDVHFAFHFDEAEPNGKWISQTVARASERLIASEDYLARRGAPGAIADLARHDLLSWRAPGDDGRLWPSRAGAAFPVEPKVVSADIHTIRQCCLAGLGIALVPDPGVPLPGMPEDALVAVLPGLVGRDRMLRMTVPVALAETPNIRMVRAWILGFLSDV